jgi:hypothetical protein
MDNDNLDAPPPETQEPVQTEIVSLNLVCANIQHYPPGHRDSPEGIGVVLLHYSVDGEEFCEHQSYFAAHFEGDARVKAVQMQKSMVLTMMARRVAQMISERDSS